MTDDPNVAPDGQPVLKRFTKGQRPFQTTPNPKRRKTDRNRQPRILDAYEAMEQRRKGRLYEDDDISPFTVDEDDQ